MKHLHLTRVLACTLALVLLLGCTACGKKNADDTGDPVGQKLSLINISEPTRLLSIT